MPPPDDWNWKTPDRDANAGLDLRYEPGNWGDFLKGHWAAVLTRRLVEDGGPQAAIRYLDPFAGAPTYPLVPAARERLEQQGDALFSRLQEPHIPENRLASTGRLVAEVAASHGGATELTVFDLDAARCAAWNRYRPGSVADATCGEALLAAVAERPPSYDLVLIDPYDFSTAWPRLLPAAVRLAKQATVLIYSYNKAPRGGGHRRASETLRRQLGEALVRVPSTSAILGRLAADPVLPRAYHEVLLLAPAPVVEACERELQEATEMFARRQAERGAFEHL